MDRALPTHGGWESPLTWVCGWTCRPSDALNLSLGENTIDRKNAEVIGAALRTRPHTNPMFISLGHRISLETSIRYVLACSRGYRLPEPTRLADKLSKDNAWSEPQ